MREVAENFPRVSGVVDLLRAGLSTRGFTGDDEKIHD